MDLTSLIHRIKNPKVAHAGNGNTCKGFHPCMALYYPGLFTIAGARMIRMFERINAAGFWCATCASRS